MNGWVPIESSGLCLHRASTYVLAVTGRFLPSRVRRRVRASQTGVREAPAGGSQKEPQEFEATLGVGELRVGTPKTVQHLLLEESFQEDGF